MSFFNTLYSAMAGGFNQKNPDALWNIWMNEEMVKKP